MADYEKWLVMARASFAVGDLARNAELWRPATTEYYYAGYQAVTALLIYIGTTPPEDREAWSHEDTPRMVVQRVSTDLMSRDDSKKIRDRLAQLYRLRVKAHYRASQDVSADELFQARREAGFILDKVNGIIAGGRQ